MITLRQRLFAHRTGIACRMGQQVLGWDTLHQNAAALASSLVGEKAPILLYGERSPEYLTCIVACLLAGRTYIPAGGNAPLPRLAAILEQSGATQVMAISPLPQGLLLPPGVRVITPAVQPECEPLEELPPVWEDDIAYLLFTSGSTGVPKGVAVTYGNWENFAHWLMTLDALQDQSPMVVLNGAQFNFDLSLADMTAVFYLGGTLVLHQPGDTAPVQEARLAVWTPSLADQFLRQPDFDAVHWAALRVVFFCGEVLRPATVRRLWQRFPQLRILNAYGPTEATCAVSAVEITPAMAAAEQLPIARQRAENAVVITVVDVEGKPLPEGETGEILLQGKSVAWGYLGQQLFPMGADGRCFATGDLGYWKDGYLWYAGRADLQVKYKGYRVEPGEIEAALCALPGVQAAVVLPHFAADGRVISLQAHICADEAAVTEDTLLAALRQRLPDYMVPRRIIFHRRLPLNANGKIDRKKVEQYDP